MHIKTRLEMRGIEHVLPRRIFEEASERYYDAITGHLVAVKAAELYERNREVMVAYVIESDCITLLTIHPLKEGQKDNRIRSGRWRKIA
jgi:hypothetical protein